MAESVPSSLVTWGSHIAKDPGMYAVRPGIPHRGPTADTRGQSLALGTWGMDLQFPLLGRGVWCVSTHTCPHIWCGTWLRTCPGPLPDHHCQSQGQVPSRTRGPSNIWPWICKPSHWKWPFLTCFVGEPLCWLGHMLPMAFSSSQHVLGK